jgi:hypothetical protein
MVLLANDELLAPLRRGFFVNTTAICLAEHRVISPMIIGTALRPLSQDLQAVPLWAAGGLAIFGMMASLGFGK